MLGMLVMALGFSGQAKAQVVVPPLAVLNVPSGGTMDLGCTTLDVQGTFNVNNGQLNNTGNIGIAATGTLNGGQGTVRVGGNWNNSGNFVAGTGTVMFVDGCSAGPALITGTAVFNNLTLTSSNGRTFVLPAGTNITVNGTLTLQGAPGQPLQLVSASGLPATITLGAGAQVLSSFVNVAANVQIGAPVVTAVQSVPTLNDWGLIVLTLLMATVAAWQAQTQVRLSRVKK